MLVRTYKEYAHLVNSHMLNVDYIIRHYLDDGKPLKKIENTKLEKLFRNILNILLNAKYYGR